MPNKAMLITYGYHFLCEAILSFFAFLLIFHYYYSFVPYGRYFLWCMGICLLFTWLATRVVAYWPYFITSLLLMVGFYLTGFPVFMCITIPGVLTWRYLQIRNDSMLGREQIYIRIGILASVTTYLLIGDGMIILYAILLFLIIFTGYFLQHFIILPCDERKRFGNKIWMGMTGLFILGMSSFFLLFHTGQAIFFGIGNGLSYGASFVASKIGFLFSWMNFNKVTLPQSSPNTNYEMNAEQTFTSSPTLIEKIGPYLFWGFVVLVMIVISILVIRLSKRRFIRNAEIDMGLTVTYQGMETPQQKGRYLRSIRSYFQKPEHPVRRLMFHFEKQMQKYDYGRLPCETVDAWFKRTHVIADIAIYQKVRYGQMDVSRLEINKLKGQLQKMIKEIQTRSTGEEK